MDNKRLIRDSHIDCVAGLMICVMVLHHLAFVSLVGVTDKVFFFFLAWFFFKSGMYHSCKKSIFKVVMSSTKKMLVPYVVFLTISMCVYSALEYCRSGYLNILGDIKSAIVQILYIGSVEYNGTLWFLLSLFVVKILTSLCFRNKMAVALTIVVSLAMTYLYTLFPNRNVPYYIGNIPLGVVFYGLGYLLKEMQFNAWVGYGSLLIYAIAIIMCDIHFDFWSAHMTGFLPTVFLLLVGCIAVNRLFVILTNNLRLPVLNWIGINSMPIYTMHGVVLYLLMYINREFLHFSLDYPFFILSVLSLFLVLFVYVTIYNHYKLQR